MHSCGRQDSNLNINLRCFHNTAGRFLRRDTSSACLITLPGTAHSAALSPSLRETLRGYVIRKCRMGCRPSLLSTCASDSLSWRLCQNKDAKTAMPLPKKVLTVLKSWELVCCCCCCLNAQDHRMVNKTTKRKKM